MRRSLGLLLFVLGIVSVVVGMASGCGSLFSFSGRHPVAVFPVTPGMPLVQTFQGRADKRYTLAVQVVFDRASVSEQGGIYQVEAKFPFAASVETANVNGWLDPNEPPSVLYGQSPNPNEHRPKDVPPPELLVERLVGPVLSLTDHALVFHIDLGADRIGHARIQEARAILYDDALPPQITWAFAGAGVGALVLIFGAFVFVTGMLRARRGGSRRR